MQPRLNDLQEYLVHEFVDDYREGQMSRRDMVRRVLGITGGAASTATLLLSLGCAPAPTPTTQPTAIPAAAAPTAAPTTAPTVAPTAMPAAAAATPPLAATTAPAGGTPAAKPAATAPGTARSSLAVSADDPDVDAEDVTFPGEGATLMGYLAQPTGATSVPAILVCHENRGLTEHIRDVTRRLAKAGYVALAVDLLSREGGTDAVDSGQVPGMLSANPNQPVADFQAGFQHLQTLDTVESGKIGMVGFCFGGGITWRMAVAQPELKAAVPFYGPGPAVEDIPKIEAAVLAIYGENDQRINAGIPEIEAAMEEHNKTFENIIYPGANHGFHNDTGNNWNEQAATDAWEKTLAWFATHLE